VPRGVFFSAAAIVLARNAAVLLGLVAVAAALGRLGFGERTAALAAALTFFGGPLVFYSLVGMTHAPTFALAGLALLLLVRQRGEGGLGLAFAAGAVLGLATLVRFGAGAILAAALPAVAPARARLALAAGFAAPLAVLPFYWWAATGEIHPPGYGGSWHLTAASPWNVLLSPRHGLFLFHPALLLAAAGLVLALVARRGHPAPPAEPPEAAPATGLAPYALLWFLAVAFVNGGWSEWANEGGYGQRFLIDALPALALGFAALLARPGGRSWKLPALAAATAFGYLLFFGAVSGLAAAPDPHPWPQRLSDYGPLLADPPGPAALGQGLARASFLVRALAP
jgi:hypothetical protein